jgi:hypothetical protein
MHKKYVTSAVLALVLLAGCGGSDSAESSSSETPSAASAAPEAEPTNAPEETAAEVEDTATDLSTEDTFPPLETVAPVDTDFSGEDSGDFCDLLQRVTDEEEESSIGDPEASPEQLQADLARFDEIFAELEDKAPDEIKADVGLMAQSFAVLDEFYARYDYDEVLFTEALQADPTLGEEYTSALAGIGDVDSASVRLEAYTTDVCGILTS